MRFLAYANFTQNQKSHKARTLYIGICISGEYPVLMRYVGLLVEFVAFQCKTNLDFDDPDDSNLEMAQDI